MDGKSLDVMWFYNNTYRKREKSVTIVWLDRKMRKSQCYDDDGGVDDYNTLLGLMDGLTCKLKLRIKLVHAEWFMGCESNKWDLASSRRVILLTRREISCSCVSTHILFVIFMALINYLNECNSQPHSRNSQGFNLGVKSRLSTTDATNKSPPTTSCVTSLSRFGKMKSTRIHTLANDIHGRWYNAKKYCSFRCWETGMVLNVPRPFAEFDLNA